MSFNVSEFRSSLVYDGARPSLFEVTMTVPAPISLADVNRQITFRARAASLPGDSVTPIVVNYFGREIKVAGSRTFPEYTITVINDEDFTIRNTFERWMSAINSHVNNLRDPAFVSGDAQTSNGGGYQADVFVTQFGKAGTVSGFGAPGNELKTYGMIGAFPTDVSPIDLDWGNADSIEEFTITFAYQWWETYTTNGIPGSPATTDTAAGR